MIYNYNNLKINYEIFADDTTNTNHPPLLLLHGWMAKIEAMAPIYNHFKSSRKVIVLDFPGQAGKSDTLTDAWGVPEYSEMVYSFINDLNLNGCDVIGHSFGGRVIIYLSSLHKDLFNRIVLTDSAGIKPKASLKKTFKIYSYKLAKIIYKLIMPKEKYEAKLSKMRAKNSSSDYAMLNSDTMRETFKKVINLDLSNRLKLIENPTLIIWGEKDTDTPIYMAKKLEKNIKDSGLVVIENAGHFSYLDNTNKYLVVANEFLK